MSGVERSPLGQQSAYVDQYDAGLLFAIPRSEARAALGITSALPFVGEDVWNAYELSWLSPSGLPLVALLELRVPCDSDFLVESKSLKLYMNSFANSVFVDRAAVAARIGTDLSALLKTRVGLTLHAIDQAFAPAPASRCIDDQPVKVSHYEVDADLLATGDEQVSEHLHSHLLRSRCPVTGQPDWATLHVQYRGRVIQSDALLRYLVSYRNHQGFHEQLVEQIFCDIKAQCQPQELTVYGRFTRRGGIDINPWRSTHQDKAVNWREIRQ